MNIFYEDSEIIVIEKPAGVPTLSAGIGVTDLESELKKYRKLKGETPEIYVVHRLDQPVGGIMVFAKNQAAAGKLSRSMQGQEFTKIYEALVYKKGLDLKREQVLTDWLLKDAKTNTSKVVDKNVNGAKEAKLKYEVLDESGSKARLRVTLYTGRHHQIRVQLAHAGLPILGDRKYGTEESNAFSQEMGIKNVALTAAHLEFLHPKTNKKMSFDLTEKEGD